MAKYSETLMALIQLLLSLLPSINTFVFKVYISLDYKTKNNGTLSQNITWIKYFAQSEEILKDSHNLFFFLQGILIRMFTTA